MAIDFEREGLLDGLDDPQGREARLDLLRQLSDAGVSLEQLKRAVEEDRLLGLPLELVFTRGMRFTLDDEDMESWRMLKLLFDAGISEEQILQLARPSGRWAAQLVDVLRQVFVEAFFEPGDTERDFGLRLAKLSADLVPTLGPLTERPVRLHLRERVRHDVISFTELTSGVSQLRERSSHPRLWSTQRLASNGSCWNDVR